MCAVTDTTLKDPLGGWKLPAVLALRVGSIVYVLAASLARRGDVCCDVVRPGPALLLRV